MKCIPRVENSSPNLIYCREWFIGLGHAAAVSRLAYPGKFSHQRRNRPGDVKLQSNNWYWYPLVIMPMMGVVAVYLEVVVLNEGCCVVLEALRSCRDNSV